MPEPDQPPPGRTRRCRQVVTIPATCPTHGNTPAMANLTITSHAGGIELDPHSHGRCALILDAAGARALCATLAAWAQQ